MQRLVGVYHSDWPDHRMLCGFKDGRLQRAVVKDPTLSQGIILSPPMKFPFRFVFPGP